MAEWASLRSFLSQPQGKVRYVMAPFMQEGALRFLLAEGGIETVLVTRWLPDDLLSGASDPGAYVAARDNGWTFMIHPTIHLKAYTWDLAKAIVGSANVTNRGLGIQNPANEEILHGPVELGIQRRLQLQRILHEASVVDDRMFEAANAWLAEQVAPIPPTPMELPSPVCAFLMSSLPMTDSPSHMLEILSSYGTKKWEILSTEERACALHDASTYHIEGLAESIHQTNLDMVRDSFFEVPFIQALERQLQPCLQFGALKAWIQANCTDVPVPSRRDLTGKVQTLLTWFAELDPTTYRVDVPGARSERLCNVKRFGNQN